MKRPKPYKYKFIHWINTTDEGQIFSYFIMLVFVLLMSAVVLRLLEV